MSTSPPATYVKVAPGYEPIPGYRVISLIGHGGYGEVWKCRAPGGLQKAIKFVYGELDERRAERELKSLERIKRIRHPFLLNLDRIDQAGGRLVIVTELADGSLEEQLQQYQQRGSCGIPKGGLLSYLSDAADALDYLRLRHNLQHLDVKPGNLLLMGDRIKVADFGLLKDLQDATQSMVSGLTPVYAPPELFDGRPSVHSDQYSLAVVYQELLTGVRPFSGRTIAQLATQHMHSAPELAPLLPADRPIVARALEKNPDRRFSNCREFIDSLKRAGDPRHPVKLSLPSMQTAGEADASGVPGHPAAAPAPKVNQLPALQVDRPRQQHCGSRQALVVGLGSTGAQCLEQLLARTAAGGDDASKIDGLLIDTDGHALHDFRDACAGDGRSEIKSMHLPLKPPQRYRQLTSQRLRSISRRWLYNIPRSGRTESLRPLGRLALVDHAQWLAATLSQIVADLAESAQQRGTTVYVAASIDGGTGSGMINDLVHLLRHLLDHGGLAEARLVPLLATDTLRISSQRGVAGHNAAVTLSEFRHVLNIAHGYPGDAGVQWPPVSAALSPLRQAYLVAPAPRGQPRPTPAETLADYVWLDHCVAPELLAEARLPSDSRRSPASGTAALRSVGVVRLGSVSAADQSMNTAAITVAHRLLSRWLPRGGAPAASTVVHASTLAAPGSPGPVDHQVDQPDSLDSLSRTLSTSLRLSASALIEDALASWPIDTASRSAALQAWVEGQSAEILASPQRFKAALGELLASTLKHRLLPDVDPGAEVLQQLAQAVSRQQIRYPDCLVILRRLLDDVRQSEAEVIRLRAAHPPPPEIAAQPTREQLVKIAQGWLWKVVCETACRSLEHLKHSLSQAGQAAERRLSVLQQCGKELSTTVGRLGLQNEKSLGSGWQQQLDLIVDRLDGQLARSVLASPLGDQSTSGDAQHLRHLLIEAACRLLPAPRAAGSGQVGAPQGNEAGRGSEPPADSGDTSSCPPTTAAAGKHVRPAAGDELTACIRQALLAVQPPLLQCGGSQRLMLLVGSQQQRQRLEGVVRQEHRGPLTTITLAGIEPMLVCEAQEVSISDVIARIASIHGSRKEILGKLQSRCDIDWD